ncbi:MAG: sn-glycerol-3-phosphate ABC transporter ATP-binding protein UgpC [Salinisphaera sp.]|jgi:sn-glycerol 3-phosphate transport system ATP-binding protein|nr:sn-glycerol-3-phosphate ABC transporter ATP-binding protein UgpC [Salinisphaera sp.]
MAAIEFEKVKKAYGSDAVLHGIDLAVDKGEFLIVVGPSGCGKSTLLRMLAGLEEISDGTISIGGRVVNKLEPRERDIAMVFQNYALYPHMSVYNNMAYGLKIRRMPKAEIKARIDKAVEILQLDPAMLQRRPRQLSGGQRQRVAMGRAIVREPSVFLFDEPLSNLDAKLRVQMRIEIKRLHQLLGITTLYVTHDQVEAMTLGERLVVMNGGHIEQVGPPSEVYDWPATRFVAGFIGSPAMNFMAGTIDDSGEYVILEGGERLALPAGAAYAAGRAVDVGIRPEHLTAVADGPFSLSVELVENLGADSLLHAYNEQGAMICRLPGHSSLLPGQRVTLDVMRDAPIHLFDSETQRRLHSGSGRSNG